MNGLDGLLRGLPNGEAQYSRDHESGSWSVSIFKRGTVEVLATIATNMDKSVACWLMCKVNDAFDQLHKKES